MKREVLNIKELRLWNYETKDLRSAYRWYKVSRDYTLYHAYSNYSDAKESAWAYCERLCDTYNGWGLKVIGHNCMTFSAGFEFNHPVTGVLCFAFITKSYDRFMYVKEVN